ncbi:hypothetical protein GCM10027565_40040 [Bordetella tumulicola]
MFNKLLDDAKFGAANAKKHTRASPAMAVPYFSRMPRINSTSAAFNDGADTDHEYPLSSRSPTLMAS